MVVRGSVTRHVTLMAEGKQRLEKSNDERLKSPQPPPKGSSVSSAHPNLESCWVPRQGTVTDRAALTCYISSSTEGRVYSDREI